MRDQMMSRPHIPWWRLIQGMHAWASYSNHDVILPWAVSHCGSVCLHMLLPCHLLPSEFDHTYYTDVTHTLLQCTGGPTLQGHFGHLVVILTRAVPSSCLPKLPLHGRPVNQTTNGSGRSAPANAWMAFVHWNGTILHVYSL
jgi:hypothetical protein